MTESEYTYLMETNEDDGDVSAFLEFSAAMDRATNDWELVQVAKRWMKAKMVRRSRTTAFGAFAAMPKCRCSRARVHSLQDPSEHPSVRLPNKGPRLASSLALRLPCSVPYRRLARE